ncbi:hypothetical protein [Marinobacterium lutimaris]|uniref:Uncharacterized protein n=1 Tax=Marinobacterium lutimaris TaxID=568106 RepID=A0A1H5YCC1_9GAMM|nr:hypothetical protein [Marinobacterium lutimaris]SEG21412.1 hypothetical protein SAMN05444390_1011694 [Marinobacterium lutimaris]
MKPEEFTLLDGVAVLLPYFGLITGVLLLAMLLAPIVAGLQAWHNGENVREAVRIFVHVEIYPLPGMTSTTGQKPAKRQHRSAS